MGHVDTPAAQSAHMLRWRHGSSTTALGRSRQTTHDASPPSSTARGGGPAGSLRAGSALHSPTPVTRALLVSSQVRTELWMRLAARLRCLRRAFLRHRSHARTHRWRRRAASNRGSLVRSPSIRTRSAALGSSRFAFAGLRARISVVLSKSRLARARATTSGDAVPPRLSRTLVSMALVASARADCRSSTAFASSVLHVEERHNSPPTSPPSIQKKASWGSTCQLPHRLYRRGSRREVGEHFPTTYTERGLVGKLVNVR